MANSEDEPEVTLDDTQPRPPVIGVFKRAGDDEDDEDEFVDERSGCQNPLLIGTVLLMLLCLCVTLVGLAGFVGYRDGVNGAATKRAVALVGTIGAQATLAQTDCTAGRFELCNERCKYISTQQPSFPGMAACMSGAQLALSATPVPLATATPVQPAATAPTVDPSAANTASGGTCSPEELFVRGQEAYRSTDYEGAMKWLEALRGCNGDYQRATVEDMLVGTYEALGKLYQNQGRLSEMVVVIQKALKIRSLPDTDWEFTVNATQLYLDAKGYLAAGDFRRADNVFNRLMDIAPTYLDTKTLACQAFAGAGDTAASGKFKC